ncbi:hypothetical protein Sjap_016214 [Stephania japonica]|uniref:Uncharacterized protein n=1 Tax=Stephania japonica TaxID=461633 RepID=A0AAP0IKW8_9MAGN
MVAMGFNAATSLRHEKTRILKWGGKLDDKELMNGRPSWKDPNFEPQEDTDETLNSVDVRVYSLERGETKERKAAIRGERGRDVEAKSR